MDQTLSRTIGVLTSSKAVSTYAGILLGGIIFLIAAYSAGYLSKPPGPPTREDGEAFLAEHAKEAGVKVLPSGLHYRLIKAGTGPKPTSPDQTVSVNYTGKFVNGHVFDSSDTHGPAEFRLNQVIPGWTEGVQMMHVGEKAELVIPYQLAYGEEGRGPEMPGYQTLIFEVELLSVK